MPSPCPPCLRGESSPAPRVPLAPPVLFKNRKWLSHTQPSADQLAHLLHTCTRSILSIDPIVLTQFRSPPAIANDIFIRIRSDIPNPKPPTANPLGRNHVVVNQNLPCA